MHFELGISPFKMHKIKFGLSKCIQCIKKCVPIQPKTHLFFDLAFLMVQLRRTHPVITEKLLTWT